MPDADLEALARLAGFQFSPLGADGGAPAPKAPAADEMGRPDAAARTPPSPPPPPPPATELPLWLHTAADYTPLDWGDSPTGPGLRAIDRGDPKRATIYCPPPAPVVPWSRLEHRLLVSLNSQRPRRALKVSAVVRTLSQGRRLKPIPHQTREVWPANLHIWDDRSPRLLPVWRDHNRVVRALRHRCGTAQVTRRGLTARVQAVFGPEHPFVRSVRAGDTVLALSDLGVLGHSGDVLVWQEVGRLLKARGAHLVALTPVAAPFALRHWSPIGWTGSPPRTSGAQVEALLTLAGMAELIQPGLVRALRRLVPGSTVADELGVWNHEVVVARAASGVVVGPEHLARLRGRFGLIPKSTRAEALATIARWHTRMPVELVHAETLNWHVVNDDCTHGRLDEALAFFRRVAETLEVAHDRDELNLREMSERLCARAAAPKPHQAEVSATLNRLKLAAAGQARSVELPSAINPGAKLPFGSVPVGNRYAVRQVGNALHFAPCGEAWPSDPIPGSPLAWLEAALPRAIIQQGDRRVWHPLGDPFPFDAGLPLTLRTDRQGLTLSRITRPEWATACGRDRYGLWAEMTVGEVRHRLRWIPPGRFLMGSPESEEGRWDGEGPQHEVTLTEGFWLGETTVTQALWEAVVGENPSHFKEPMYPVEQVSWSDTLDFFDRLAGQQGFRAHLPTEAQWEYACRAGTTTRYWSGDSEADLARVGWFSRNSDHQSQPVGGRPANPWGLHDMHGGVWEWCSDFLDQYLGEPSSDPTGRTHGDSHVIRGGAWYTEAHKARSAYRRWAPPDHRTHSQGFRLAKGQTVQPSLPTSGTPKEKGLVHTTHHQAHQIQSGTLRRKNGAGTLGKPDSEGPTH